MSLGLPTIEVLRTIYRPSYENASMKFTPFDLGAIRVTAEQSNTLLTFRRQNNPGGFLEPRGEGENITVKTGGLSYTDEKVKTYGFADARRISVGQLGLRNPESLNPSDRDTIARVATTQMDELMAEAANTLRIWGSLAFLPSITYTSGDTTLTLTNQKVDSTSLDVDTTAPWSNTSTDIVTQILGWKRDFFGTEKPANGMTIMVSTRQRYNLMKNTSVIDYVTYNQFNPTNRPSQVSFAQIADAFLSLEDISIVEWNDAYYANNNESDPYNTTAFLDANHVVLVPNVYYNRVSGSLVYQQIGSRNRTAPFIELITAPSADFEYKVERRDFPTNVMGTIPGAYVFSGFVRAIDPGKPDTYETHVALDVGLFIERSLKIKHVKVTS